MLILQLPSNLTNNELPHPFENKRCKYKSSFDPLVSYDHFQLVFLSILG